MLCIADRPHPTLRLILAQHAAPHLASSGSVHGYMVQDGGIRADGTTESRRHTQWTGTSSEVCFDMAMRLMTTVVSARGFHLQGTTVPSAGDEEHSPGPSGVVTRTR